MRALAVVVSAVAVVYAIAVSGQDWARILLDVGIGVAFAGLLIFAAHRWL